MAKEEVWEEDDTSQEHNHEQSDPGLPTGLISGISLVLCGILSTVKDLSSVGSESNTDHSILDLALRCKGCRHVSIGALLQNYGSPVGKLGVVGRARFLYPIVQALHAEHEHKDSDAPDDKWLDLVVHTFVKLLKPIEHRVLVAKEDCEGQPYTQLPSKGQLVPRVGS